MSPPDSDISSAAGQTAAGLFAHAATLAEHGDSDGALAAYQEVLNHPESGLAAEAGFLMGEALKTAGDVASAATAFHRGLDAADSAYRARCGIHLGVLLGSQGDSAGALAATLRALETEYNDYAALASLNAGIFAEKTGNLGLAIAAYRQAVACRKEPESAQALSQLRVLFGVGEPRTLEIEGFSGGEHQATHGAVVMALSNVASCTLSMTVTLGAIGSGKTGQSGVLELASASATGSDLVFRWVSKSADDALFIQLMDYVVRTVGPHVAERLLPAVVDGDGVRIGGLTLSSAGVEITRDRLSGQKVDVLAWPDYDSCSWSSVEVNIRRRDPNGGKGKSIASISRNTPNAFVLPALLTIAANSLKNQPAGSRPVKESRGPNVVQVPLPGLKQLQAFDVNGSGQVAVIDMRTLGARVVLYDPAHDSQVQLPFSKLQNPRGVAVADDGTVYVVDRSRKRPSVLCLPRAASSASVLTYGIIPQHVATGEGSSLYVTAKDGDGLLAPSRRVFRFPADGGTPSQLPFTGVVEIRALAANSRGEVVVGGKGVLAKLDAGSQHEQRVDLGIDVEALALNDRGDVFVGGSDRILVLAADGSAPELITRVSGLVGLACNRTGSLFVATAVSSGKAYLNKLVSIAVDT